jgi:porin
MRKSFALLVLILFLFVNRGNASDHVSAENITKSELAPLAVKPVVTDSLGIVAGQGLLAEESVAMATSVDPSSSGKESEEILEPAEPVMLFGTFGGVRSWLAEHGVTLEFVYKGDYWSRVAGGLHHGHTYLDNVDYKIALDAEKLVGWKGTSLLISFLTNDGTNPSDVAGDAQGVSNIAAFNTTKLYQAWIDVMPFTERLSVLAGLYDLNSEFYVTNTSGLFLHPTQGIGIELAQTGFNGPSIFPTTALAARVRYAASGAVSIQAVALDGVAGDPDDRCGTHIKFGGEYGALLVTEATYSSGGGDGANGLYRKFGVGGWTYTGKFDDLIQTDVAGLPLRRSDNHGVYFVAESDIMREAGDGSRGLAAFLRAGVANGHINQFSSCFAGGCVYTGLIPGRENDHCGLAFGVAHNGREYLDAMESAGSPAAAAEVVIEFTYRASVMDWLALQPDLEYIINPGTDRTIPNACMFGVRLQVSM